MPFYELLEGDQLGDEKRTVDLRHLPPKGWMKKVRFQLMEGLAFRAKGASERQIVRAHDLARPEDPGQNTDLASVPPFLWGVVASYGAHSLPAILHDKLCNDAKNLPSDEALSSRKKADRIFRVALKESEVNLVRRWVLWTAVRTFGVLSHKRPIGLALLAAIVTASVGIYGLITPDVWLWSVRDEVSMWLAVGSLSVLTALALPSPDLMGAALIAIAFSWITVVLVINLLASLLMWVPAVVGWLLSSRVPGYDPGPFPSPAPTRYP